MSLKAQIQHTIGISDMVVDKYLSDLPPEAFLVRPVPGMNHIAWQVGHLLSTERRFIEGIKPGSSPAFPEGFDAQHSRENHSVDDPAAFLTKDQYLALWKAQRDATKAALETMTDAELAAPNPVEATRHMGPTVGSIFNMAGLHTLMHAGQFVAARRREAMPIVF